MDNACFTQRRGLCVRISLLTNIHRRLEHYFYIIFTASSIIQGPIQTARCFFLMQWLKVTLCCQECNVVWERTIYLVLLCENTSPPSVRYSQYLVTARIFHIAPILESSSQSQVGWGAASYRFSSSYARILCHHHRHIWSSYAIISDHICLQESTSVGDPHLHLMSVIVAVLCLVILASCITIFLIWRRYLVVILILIVVIILASCITIS